MSELQDAVVRGGVVIGFAVASLVLSVAFPLAQTSSVVAAIAGASGLATVALGGQLRPDLGFVVLGAICAVGVLFPLVNGDGFSIVAVGLTVVGLALAYMLAPVPVEMVSIAPFSLAASAALPGSGIVSGLVLGAAVFAVLAPREPSATALAKLTDDKSESEPRSMAGSVAAPLGSTMSTTAPVSDRFGASGGSSSVIQLGAAPRGSNLVTAVPASFPPYAPAKVSDQYEAGLFTVLCHSRRGVAHVHSLEPRQDDYAVATTEDGKWLVVAVCDGLGSAPSSHVGSYWASRLAINVIALALAKKNPTNDFFAEAFGSIAKKMTWVAETVANTPTQAIATTLVVAVIDNESGSGRVARVGDSDALMRGLDEWTPVFGSGTPDVTTETYVMPRDAALVEIADVQVGQGECLLVGTDGVCDLIATSGDVVGRRFLDDLHAPCSLDHFERLVGFERRGALDDRTLVAIWGGS